MLISNGRSSDDISEIETEAQLLKDQGIHIICIEVHDKTEDVDELLAIASSESHIFLASSYADLNYTIDPLMALACFSGKVMSFEDLSNLKLKNELICK